MSEQGKRKTTVRSVLLGLAVASLAGTLVGCTTGGAKGHPFTTTASSNAEFKINFYPNKPVDEQVVVDPNGGDASLVTVVDPKLNFIIWRSDRPFAIKFMQIDDHSQKPSKKLGKERDDWNYSDANHVYKLELDKGSDSLKKTIRGAKYIVTSPHACTGPNPGLNCMVLDPVLIVRY